METQKVDMFMMSNGAKFPEEKAMFIREKLLAADDGKWGIISSLQFKDSTIAIILSIFLGQLGIDRFYIGDTGLGIGKLLTCGGCGIWAIVDWFLITKATKEKNYEKLSTVL
ncbi:MAG: TM2 domain-containing protein [Evtepia sp.]|nr:TM2 domain-containing protein [Marinifilaceae bacterium]MDY4173655.1 TM2 domain-containing protein [Evtepia sp.]